MKQMLNQILIRFKSDLSQILTKLLTSFNQYTVNSLTFTVNWLEFDLWHICNITFLFKNSCLHKCCFLFTWLINHDFTDSDLRNSDWLIDITSSQISASVICLNRTYEIWSRFLWSLWISLYQHSIIHCLDLILFIWLCIVFNLDSIWSSKYHLSFNVHRLQ